MFGDRARVEYQVLQIVLERFLVAHTMLNCPVRISALALCDVKNHQKNPI
jgi:hypothetical protein